MLTQCLAECDTDGVQLRNMTRADLVDAHRLTTEQRWPHREMDWQEAWRHGEGWVAERDGKVVATGLRWRWGAEHATFGLIVVAEAHQGRRIGQRLVTRLLDGLDGCHVLLHATSAGRGLYERMGFARIGELRQHQGLAQPSPPVALEPGWRLRPAGQNDLERLRTLDMQARGMPREALIHDLLRDAEAAVALDQEGTLHGFAMLRRFGRGYIVGPVIAPDINGARALIAHLTGLYAGRFVRIDIDFESGLAEWLESIGLLRVDMATIMTKGPSLPPAGPSRLFAVVTQALG